MHELGWGIILFQLLEGVLKGGTSVETLEDPVGKEGLERFLLVSGVEQDDGGPVVFVS